jgi:hypothetical protein
MINQDIVAQDLFYKLRSRFPKLSIGDANGRPTYEAKEGRFFDFDAIFDGVNLGRVSISINEAGSLKLYFGRNLLEDLDEVLKSTWFKFLKEMRAFSKKRMLSFDTRDIGKSNLDKRDFHYLANKDNVMSESIAYGTNMTSYRPLSKAKIIIRHKTPVVADVPGARSRNISHIFIQNEDGERYKMKVNHLPTAEAMARHVSHGNQPYDAFGRHIEECGHNIAMLSNFKRYSTHHMDKMNPDASDIVTRANEHLENLKNYVRQLGKTGHYLRHKDAFHAADDAPMELDQATMESYKDKFTVRNYNEDLSAVFPLLHKIMSEQNNEINLEDLMGEAKEGEACEVCHEDPCTCDDEKAEESFNPELAFENFANLIVETQMTPEGIQQLQDLLAGGIQAGAGGESAISALEELGLSDPKLEKMLEGIGDATPDKNVATDVVEWLRQTNNPVLDQLDLNQIPGANIEEPAQIPMGEPAQMAEAMKHERYINLIKRMQDEGVSRIKIANEEYSVNDLRVMSEGMSAQIIKHAKADIKDKLESGEMDKHDAIIHLMSEFDISDTLAKSIVKKLVGHGHIDQSPEFSAHSEDDYNDDQAFMQGLKDRIGRGSSIGIDDFGGEMDENAGGMGAGSVASGPTGKKPGLLAEDHPLMINGKEVDMRSLEIDGVDRRDYPDFSDAYISYATFTDGTELNDAEIEELNSDGDLVNELAHDSLHEDSDKLGEPSDELDEFSRVMELSGLKEAKEKTMSRAAKGHEKYGKEGMQKLAKAGREGAGEGKLDKIRDKYDRYDESMTKEELKGNQKKIDANHNGKIDADDFKKLRAGKEEPLDEVVRVQGTYYPKGPQTQSQRNDLARVAKMSRQTNKGKIGTASVDSPEVDTGWSGHTGVSATNLPADAPRRLGGLLPGKSAQPANQGKGIADKPVRHTMHGPGYGKGLEEVRRAKPDYIDLDHDGDKKEPMKKAAKDAKSQKTDKGLKIAGPKGKLPESVDMSELRDIMKLSGMHKDSEHIAHDKEKESELVERPEGSMREVAEFIKSFYNREDGTFPLGETGVKVKVEKRFGERAGQLAEKLIQRLSAHSPRKERSEFEDMTTSTPTSMPSMPTTSSMPQPKMAMEQDLSILKQLAGLR